MKYMKITDAVNDGIKKLVATLPADLQKKINWVATDDIATCFKSLADVLMYVNGINGKARSSLYEAHGRDSFTAADNMGLVMDVLLVAAKNEDKKNDKSSQNSTIKNSKQNSSFAGIPDSTDENT